MEKRVSATEAVRKFSDILNSIKYKGDSYQIIRGGKPVAFICPVETPMRERHLGELKELVKSLPGLGSEAEKFERDVKEILKSQPTMPKEGKWA